MIIESGDRNKDRSAHKEMVEDMDKLLASPGWQKIATYLSSEAAAAFAAMQGAVTGDLMMKASQAFVTLCNIKDLPLKERNAAFQRIGSMEQEDKEAAALDASLRTRRNKP